MGETGGFEAIDGITMAGRMFLGIGSLLTGGKVTSIGFIFKSTITLLIQILATVIKKQIEQRKNAGRLKLKLIRTMLITIITTE